MCWRLEDLRSSSRKADFLLLQRLQIETVAFPASHRMVIAPTSPGDKRQSLSCLYTTIWYQSYVSVESAPTSTHVFMALCLTKHTGKFTFILRAIVKVPPIAKLQKRTDRCYIVDGYSHRDLYSLTVCLICSADIEYDKHNSVCEGAIQRSHIEISKYVPSNELQISRKADIFFSS